MHHSSVCFFIFQLDLQCLMLPFVCHEFIRYDGPSYTTKSQELATTDIISSTITNSPYTTMTPHYNPCRIVFMLFVTMNQPHTANQTYRFDHSLLCFSPSQPLHNPCTTVTKQNLMPLNFCILFINDYWNRGFERFYWPVKSGPKSWGNENTVCNPSICVFFFWNNKQKKFKFNSLYYKEMLWTLLHNQLSSRKSYMYTVYIQYLLWVEEKASS